MEKVLQSIYVHIDAASKTLANNAIAQLVVKLLYSCDTAKTRDEIVSLFEQQTHTKVSDTSSFDDILQQLVNKHEILSRKGKRYDISTTKRDRISKAIRESKDRKERILAKYFSGVFTSSDIVKEWFEDVTIKFFEIYADNWISDLLADNRQTLRNLSESIRSTILLRTKSFDGIDQRDHQELPNRFLKFVINHEADVDAYLWEHGTSRFSAQLISNRQGVDKLTLDSFSNSICLFDTNILIFIALENEDLKRSFSLLEKSFAQLNIGVKILYITKQEYEHRIDVQRDFTLKNVEKWGRNSSKIPNDPFTQCAVNRRCVSKDDYERFFSQIYQIPAYVDSQIEIKLLDDDKKLATVIENAQSDEEKKAHLKGIYYTIKKREKRENSTIHDVGLLEGTEHLRKEGGKYFILSEESSVNSFSQNRPTSNGLPLSIRVDTLINILAANGGDVTDSSEYMSLYAALIRQDLIPAEQTFTQCQLYQMYQLNNRISTLTEPEAEKIAWQVHEKMVKGESEEDLRLFINDRITETEILLKDEVKRTEEEIANVKSGLKHEKEEKESYRNELSRQYYKEELRQMRIKGLWYAIAIPFLLLLSCAIPLLIWLLINSGTKNIYAYTISLLASITLEILYYVKGRMRFGWFMLTKGKDLARKRAEDRLLCFTEKKI